jgi:hypothetical protein
MLLVPLWYSFQYEDNESVESISQNTYSLVTRAQL